MKAKRVSKGKKDKKKPRRKVKKTSKSGDVSLPEARSEPRSELRDYVTLVYGERKIGKTTLCSQFPDAFFFMFEPGGRALRIYQKPIPSWDRFIAYLDLLEEEDHDFRTVVVDTVDIAYEQCFNYMCDKLNIVHPHMEDDYGQSWGQIETEYKRQLTRLMSLDVGVVFLSHDSVSEVVSRTGRKYNRVEPSMKGQAQRFLTGVVDIWGYYMYDGNKRFLVIRGNDLISAGCRLRENFVTTEGEQVVAVPMGNSEAQAYKYFVAAFNNKLKNTYKEVLESADID